MSKTKVFIIGLVLLMLFPVTVTALEIPNPIGPAFRDFPTAVNTASRWVRGGATLLYVGMILFAGYTRLTAGADPEKAKKSMQIILYSTTGYILIILGPIIVSTIAAIFQIDLLTNL